MNGNLGLIAAPTKYRTTIEVKNVATVPITVSDLCGTCPCVSVKPSALSLEPNESSLVQLRADLTDRVIDGVTPITLSLAYSTPRVDGVTFHLHVSGLLYTPLRPATRVLTWDPATREELTTAEKSLSITSAHDCVDLVVSSRDDLFSVTKTRIGKLDWSLSIVPSESLPDGPFAVSIAVTGALADGTTVGPIDVLATGMVVGEFRAIPERLNPAACMFGDTIAASLAITSASYRSPVINSIQATSDAVSISWATVESGHEHWTGQVNFVADSPGKHDFSLVVQGLDENQCPFTVNVPTSILVIRQ